MDNVYIIFRGLIGEEDKDLISVHADIMSARVGVDEILKQCAEQGFIYTVPDASPNDIRMWVWKNEAYISIEKHEVLSAKFPPA